jgi:hypothetical protein
MLNTNKDRLIMTAVQGEVQSSTGRGYRTTWNGRPKLSIGTASINYTVHVGDSVAGWSEADHVEPDVTFQGKETPDPSDCSLAILACIGNEAKIVSGEALGGKGLYIGRHAGADDLVWFPRQVVENLSLGDKVQVKAWGVGLKIMEHSNVKVNKVSPNLLENMGITEKGEKLVVPVSKILPGWIMGAGIGYDPSVETVDYDIQTTCPETNDELGLAELKLGDVIAIMDHYDAWGRGRYEGAVTIGVIVHGWSDLAGHGPGVNPIMAALPGELETKLDSKANIKNYLGIGD